MCDDQLGGCGKGCRTARSTPASCVLTENAACSAESARHFEAVTDAASVTTSGSQHNRCSRAMTVASRHCFTLFCSGWSEIAFTCFLLPPYSEARQHQPSTTLLDVTHVPCMIRHHALPSDGLEQVVGALRSRSLSAYRSELPCVCARLGAPSTLQQH